MLIVFALSAHATLRCEPQGCCEPVCVARVSLHERRGPFGCVFVTVFINVGYVFIQKCVTVRAVRIPMRRVNAYPPRALGCKKCISVRVCSYELCK